MEILALRRASNFVSYCSEILAGATITAVLCGSMPIMSKQDWKRDTSLSFGKRSESLKAVDKALDAYHAHKTNDKLKELDTAFDEWLAEEGKQGLVSARNKRNVIARLRDEIDEELRKFAPSVAFNPLRVIAVDKSQVLVKGRNFKSSTATTRTMTDDDLVGDFVNKIKALWSPSWSTKSKAERGRAAIDAVKEVHTACQVPNVTADVKSLPPGYLGFFDSTSWAIQLEQDVFDFNYNPSNKPRLVALAETVYHESRHCEQWFHMARYFALGRTAVDVAQAQFIPQHVADAAKQRQMTSDDEMADLTKSWYESVYGTGDREITLTSLKLMRQATAAYMGDWRDRTQAAYQGDLPEEVDAWAIQLKVRAKF